MTETVDNAALTAIRAELDRLKQQVQRSAQTVTGPSNPIDSIAAADFRRMTGPDLDVVPRSHPIGYLEGVSGEQSKRMKMEAVAKSMGGRRDADPVIASVYANEWTPETEHRWEFALGLRSDPPDPLDKPEKPGSQNASHGRLASDVQRLQGRRPAG